MTRITLKILALAAVVTLAACGGEGPTGPGLPSPSLAKVTLTNQANVPIVEVNFSNCDAPSWGNNRLNGGEVIAPGASRSWSVAPGCYDFRAQTASKAGSWYDKNLVAGGTLNLALSAAANEAPMGIAK